MSSRGAPADQAMCLWHEVSGLAAVIQREKVQQTWRRAVTSLPPNIASTSDSGAAGPGCPSQHRAEFALRVARDELGA